MKVEPLVGPYNIPHYEQYKSVAVNGGNAPGYSSGQAITAMEDLANNQLSDGFGFQWTGITYQQLKAGNLASTIFALSLVFVFLVSSRSVRKLDDANHGAHGSSARIAGSSRGI